MLSGTFDKHRDADLYTLQYHVLNCMLKDIQSFGTLFIWRASVTNILMCTTRSRVDEIWKNVKESHGIGTRDRETLHERAIIREECM